MRRLRTLTLTLLPLEVPLDTISDSTSRVITPQVIEAYILAAGDLTEVVSRMTSSLTSLNNSDPQLPYCLLRARKEFMWDANHNPADYGENLCRGRCRTYIYNQELTAFFPNSATACEVLARRVTHVSPPDRITPMMSTRYTHREIDGDNSEKTSALEMAIDSHWYVKIEKSAANLLTGTVQYHFPFVNRSARRYVDSLHFIARYSCGF